MAAADTARLIASLELDDRKFRAGATRALGSINRIDRRLGAFSGAINRNLGRLVDSAVTRGTQFLVDGIQGGIESLATLEDATTSVNGAIKQMGLTGQVTGAQIAAWANQIESATDAAFDDKDITRNAAVLIRYGKVAGANLRPALQVMTDLAAKTGSVDSAASKLAKSLADPTKATRVLREVGVTLSKDQEKQIKLWVKQGKLGKAQALILREVGKATKGAARDSAGSFRDMQNTLADTREDAERLLAQGAFPVLEKLGTKFKAALADPQTMKDIENIGKGAADVLERAIEFGEKVPWGKIREGLGAAAGFAGSIVNAFASMPPEAQGAIIALAGLNKLSGGAVSGIVSELGKGLIKGVLGVQAAQVNVQGAVVTVGGPGAGGPNQPGFLPDVGKTGLLALLGIASTGTAIGTGAAAGTKALGDAIGDAIFGAGSAGAKAFQDLGPAMRQAFGPFEGIRMALAGEIPGKFDTMIAELKGLFGDPMGALTNDQRAQLTDQALQDFRKGERDAWTDTTTAVRDVKREQSMAAASLGQAIGSNEGTTRAGLSNAVAATNNAAGRISGAIAANRPITNVDVDVNVTSTGVAKATVTSNRYGPSDPGYGGPSGKYDKP